MKNYFLLDIYQKNYFFFFLRGWKGVNSLNGMKIEIFFVGNDYFYQLIRLGIFDLYICLEKFIGGWVFVRYNNFSVIDELDGYRMRVKVGFYEGNVGMCIIFVVDMFMFIMYIDIKGKKRL